MHRFFSKITVDQALAQQQTSLDQIAMESAAAVAHRTRTELLRPGPGRPRKRHLEPPVDSNAAATQPVGPDKKRGKYENWFNTPFIHDILEAFRKTGNSTRKAVAQLQLQYPRRATETHGRFDELDESTMRKWFGKDKKLLPKYKAILEDQATMKRGPGREPALAASPAAQAEIKQHLQTLRDRGGVVNTLVIRLIAEDVLKRLAPDVLSELKLGKTWCSRLATELMGWTWRTSTTAAAKLPNDWRVQGVNMAKRIAYHVQLYKVHPSLVINMDQTGVRLVSADNKTYESKGNKTVRVIGNDDKRQITVCVASSADGDLLPLQLIFEGKTALSEPAATDASRQAKVHITHSENHWSNQETMRQWVTEVLVPYADRMILQHNRPKDDHIVLVLDVWSVHISQEFRDWIKQEHPRVHLVYVPPNCTSELQVADVILQRPFKAGIRQEFHKWAAAVISEQLKSDDLLGLTPHLKMGVIKPLVLDWCVQSWSKMQAGRQYVKMGWHTCCTSLYDVWTLEKRIAVAEEVLRKEFEPEYVPARNKTGEPAYKEEQAAAAEYESESSDEEADQLDIMKQRQYGKRSTRARQPTTTFGYQIDSSQIQLSEDEI